MAKRRAGSQSASGAAGFSERATPEAGLPPEVVNGASCLPRKSAPCKKAIMIFGAVPHQVGDPKKIKSYWLKSG